MDWPEDLKFSLKKGTAKKGRRAAAVQSTSKPTSPEKDTSLNLDMNFEMDEAIKNQPPRRISGGWAEISTKSGNKSRGKNFIEDERFKKSINILSAEEEIPIIPDVDDMQDDSLLNNLVEPPSVSVNRVVTLKELNSDLLAQKAFSAIEDVDLSVLTKFLYLENELEELDESWHWDKVFTESTAEISVVKSPVSLDKDGVEEN